MIIQCPECQKEISNQAKTCIHCGYPLKKDDIVQDKNICIIDGIPRNLEEQINNINNGEYKPLKQLCTEYGMSIADASVLWDILETTKQIPSEYNSSQREEYRTQLKEIEAKSNVVKCPKCGSTQIQMVPRKWSPLTGILTNKVDRVCVKCKHKF